MTFYDRRVHQETTDLEGWGYEWCEVEEGAMPRFVYWMRHTPLDPQRWIVQNYHRTEGFVDTLPITPILQDRTDPEYKHFVNCFFQLTHWKEDRLKFRRFKALNQWISEHVHVYVKQEKFYPGRKAVTHYCWQLAFNGRLTGSPQKPVVTSMIVLPRLYYDSSFFGNFNCAEVYAILRKVIGCRQITDHITSFLDDCRAPPSLHPRMLSKIEFATLAHFRYFQN